MTIMGSVQPPVKRRYDTSRRREAAAGTRKAILDAALELFTGQGYTARAWHSTPSTPQSAASPSSPAC
jgi:hypothetical protein